LVALGETPIGVVQPPELLFSDRVQLCGHRPKRRPGEAIGLDLGPHRQGAAGEVGDVGGHVGGGQGVHAPRAHGGEGLLELVGHGEAGGGALLFTQKGGEALTICGIPQGALPGQGAGAGEVWGLGLGVEHPQAAAAFVGEHVL
jgi:hypothetical protein